MSGFQMVRVYDGKELAEDYDKYRPSYPASVVDIVMEYVKSKNPQAQNDEKLTKMLDVGCGGGQSTHIFAPYFESILGIDISNGQIATAKRNNKNSNVTFQLVHDNLFPIEDNSVDFVGSGTAVHHLDMETFIPECMRVLKKNGCVALYTFNVKTCIFKGVDYGFEFGEIRKQFFLDSRARESSYVALNKYKTLFERISVSSKTWLKTATTGRELSVTDMIHMWGTLGEYRLLMEEEKPSVDPIRVFADNVKRMIHEDESEDDDVKLSFIFEYPAIAFCK